MHLVVFEGARWSAFAPLSLGRPVFQLGSGTSTLLEKQVRHINPTSLTLWVRPELAKFAEARIAPRMNVPTRVNAPLGDEPALLMSGRSLHLKKYQLPDLETATLEEDGAVRDAHVVRPGLSNDDVLNRTDAWRALSNLPKSKCQSRVVNYVWDLVKANEESLVEEFGSLKTGSAPLPRGNFHVGDAQHLWLGENVSIKPGVVLDTSKGPIMLDRHAAIGANSVLEGPCYVGPYATVMPLTLIRPGTSVGMMCKVGGEVSNSILFAYSNKSHYGYLGDSYIGKWVNLGGGTTTSNLKNTYGEITARAGEEDVNTGTRTFGAMVGDHAKTAIGTRLMAGSYVGFGAMVATTAAAPKFVPSFTFLTDDGPAPYPLAKMLEVVGRVFARRERILNEVDRQVVEYVQKSSMGRF